MSRYFEVIITGRQLAALVAGVAILIAVAFGLGVAVRVTGTEPAAPREVIVAAAQAAAPTPAPAPPSAAPTPQPAPSPSPTATPAPPTPAPAATRAAAPAAAPRWVQVAAFGKRKQADGVRNRVVALGFTPKQAVVQSLAGGKFRVRLGPFPDGESAGRVAARLRAEGFSGAFVVKPGE